MTSNIERLQKIDHIVILMLENRSFDHMLGYLSLPESAGGRGRTDIDGLTGADDQVNAYDGDIYTPQPLHDYLSFPWDPPHDHRYVVKQIAHNNGGFVEQFAKHHKQLYKHIPLEDPGLVMGYHTADHLPAFDQLARQFCVCDRWFSSCQGPLSPIVIMQWPGHRVDTPRPRRGCPATSRPEDDFRLSAQKNVAYLLSRYSLDMAV